MKIKTLSILCILSIILTLLSGCYDARGIEELAYATAIGLDVSENNMLNLTIQISLPNSGTSPDSGSSQSNKTDITTVECSSINAGISLMNSYISKEVNLSHCKVIIISEELAEQGISEYIDTLANNIEIRPNCNIIISRCPAKDFIENASPTIETLTARYYEVALKSHEYTGYTTATKFVDFVSNVKNSAIQASAILGGVSTDDSKLPSTSDISSTSDDMYKADDMPIQNSNTVETFGTAVFYDDKLIGELNGLETICNLLITNSLNSCTISVPDVSNVNSNIDLHINRKQKTKVDVEFINNSPYITVEVFIEGYGLSLTDNTNYNSSQYLNELNQSTEEYLKLQLENYLYKTSKEFNSDISGFGKHALSKYLTISDWLSSNWLDNYKNAFFDVKVTANIKSGYEFNVAP